MQRFQDIQQVKLTHPTVLTIGTFDGVHKGHQTLVKQLKQAAQQQNALAAVLAFHPRPKAILKPGHLGNDYLTTAEERATLFAELGLDILILTPFSRDFAQISAKTFMLMLKTNLNLVELWAGHDFALGKGREGNYQRLTELGQELGYRLHEFKAYLLDGEVVSSTRIRNLIQTAKIQEATRLLGRYPSITGMVEPGNQRGRTIGFPTANLQTSSERLLPMNGVYATFVTRIVTGQRYLGVTNIGVRPSFKTHQRTVETHIFDFNEMIYEEPLKLEFVSHLRPEQKFETIDLLKQQIQHDAKQARKILQNKR